MKDWVVPIIWDLSGICFVKKIVYEGRVFLEEDWIFDESPS